MKPLTQDNRFAHLPPVQREQLEAYLQLLIKWSKTYNLTAIKDPDQMITHHLLDSLSIAPYLDNDRFVDVGTGAGLPGIPLATIYPDKQFVLLDSNVKKTRFCQQAAAELRLKNIEVVHSRVEKYHPAEKFGGVISRAYTSLTQMVNSCQHLLDKNGVYLAMKAQLAKQEAQTLPEGFQVDVKPLMVLGLEAERCLVVIKP